MQLIRPDININFVGMRYKAFVLSGFIILCGLLALFYRGGLNMGVDFAGGTLIQVKFNKPTNPDQVRDALKDLVAQSFVQQHQGTIECESRPGYTCFTIRMPLSIDDGRIDIADGTKPS